MQTANTITPDFERDAELRPSNVAGSETFDDFMLRWANTFNKYIHEAKQSTRPPVLVTHSFNVSATAMLVNAETDFRTLISAGGIAAIKLSKDEKLHIQPILGRLHCSYTTTPKN
jgi:hypothetical protein